MAGTSSPSALRAVRAKAAALARALAAATALNCGDRISEAASRPRRRPGLTINNSIRRRALGLGQGPTLRSPLVRQNGPSSLARRGRACVLSASLEVPAGTSALCQVPPSLPMLRGSRTLSPMPDIDGQDGPPSTLPPRIASLGSPGLSANRDRPDWLAERAIPGTASPHWREPARHGAAVVANDNVSVQSTMATTNALHRSAKARSDVAFIHCSFVGQIEKISEHP